MFIDFGGDHITIRSNIAIYNRTESLVRVWTAERLRAFC